MSYTQAVIMGNRAILTSDGAVTDSDGNRVSNTHNKIVVVNEKLAFAYVGDGDFCNRSRQEFENNNKYSTVEEVYNQLNVLASKWPKDIKGKAAQFFIAGQDKKSKVKVLHCGYFKFTFCYPMTANYGELKFKSTDVNIDTMELFENWMQMVIDVHDGEIGVDDVCEVLKNISKEVSKYEKGVNDNVYVKIIEI